MSFLTVGSGLQFSTIKAAIAASHDGDTIYVQAGTYRDDFAIINTDISLVGVGGMVHMVTDKVVSKAIFVTNSDVNLDHFEFSGVKSFSYNGAGIRYQAGTLNIANSYFHDNEDGILGANTAGGVVTIDKSEFSHNGAGDGQSHNIYIGMIDTFIMTNSYSHDAVVGHEVKSRALNTIIENNRIADGNGNASYTIDIPAGGNAFIANNVIQQGARSPNYMTIAYAEEIKHPQWDAKSLLVTDNTIINQSAARKATGIWNASSAVAEVTDNQIYGLPAAQLVLGASVQSGNVTLAKLPAIDSSHPWAASPWDKIVWGGSAANVLHGSGARDLFVGNGGADTFVIQKGGKSDTIANFEGGAGAGDVVRLEGYGLSSFAAAKAAMSQHGADVWLNLGNGETLTFHDMTVGAFAANDFRFTSQTGATSGNGTGLPPAEPTSERPQPFTLPISGITQHKIPGDYGNNTLIGTSQNDYLNGGVGADKMQGGLGDDRYVVDNAQDTVIEKPGQGIDTVSTTLARYTLPANVENLSVSSYVARGHTVTGNALNNLITASVFNDTLNGGGGNDILKAGIGADLLVGGTGNDIFVFAAVGKTSTIADFHPGQDLLDLRTIMHNAHYTGADPLSDQVMAITPDGHGGSMISLDPTHSGTLHDLVDLQGVTPDMIFVGLDILY